MAYFLQETKRCVLRGFPVSARAQEGEKGARTGLIFPEGNSPLFLRFSDEKTGGYPPIPIPTTC